MPPDAAPGERPARTIWTVGHSTHTAHALVALLQAYGIELVADVRSFPVSRKNPQHNREVLSEALARSGIAYEWLGESLGGYRKGGYEAHMQTPRFAEGLARLESLAAEKATAIMCAEKLFFRCHRRHIADALVRRGWRVVHIFDERRAQPHKPRGDQPTLPFDEGA